MVPNIKHKDAGTGKDARLWKEYVSKLEPVKGYPAIGNCIEVDYQPRNLRKYAFAEGASIIVRRIEDKKWRIWRNT